ncbi:MAG: orotidine 5'-phosphate decarboxylase / HUMPS family protein, partial [Aeromicrobium sp.]
DLIGVADKATRAREVTDLGAEFVEMHAGLDEQAEDGFSLDTLLTQGTDSGVAFSVAGGVSTSTIEAVQKSGASVAVAGGAIYGADDPAAAAAELRSAII